MIDVQNIYVAGRTIWKTWKFHFLSFDVCGSSKLLLSVMFWQSNSLINVFAVIASMINVIMYSCKHMFFVWDVALYLCLSKQTTLEANMWTDTAHGVSL